MWKSYISHGKSQFVKFYEINEKLIKRSTKLDVTIFTTEETFYPLLVYYLNILGNFNHAAQQQLLGLQFTIMESYKNFI